MREKQVRCTIFEEAAAARGERRGERSWRQARSLGQSGRQADQPTAARWAQLRDGRSGGQRESVGNEFLHESCMRKVRQETPFPLFLSLSRFSQRLLSLALALSHRTLGPSLRLPCQRIKIARKQGLRLINNTIVRGTLFPVE